MPICWTQLSWLIRFQAVFVLVFQIEGSSNSGGVCCICVLEGIRAHAKVCMNPTELSKVSCVRARCGFCLRDLRQKHHLQQIVHICIILVLFEGFPHEASGPRTCARGTRALMRGLMRVLMRALLREDMNERERNPGGSLQYRV